MAYVYSKHVLVSHGLCIQQTCSSVPWLMYTALQGCSSVPMVYVYNIQIQIQIDLLLNNV